MSRLAAALLVALLSLTGAPLAAGEIVEVDNAGLQKLIVAGVPVVDLRRQDEWRATGVIEGSRQITFIDISGQLNSEFAAQITRTVKPGEPVALICRTGSRSQAAARFLAGQLGYGRVYNVRDGISRWIAEGRPVAACDKC